MSVDNKYLQEKLTENGNRIPSDTIETSQKYYRDYSQYRQLGGIIKADDFRRIMDLASSTTLDSIRSSVSDLDKYQRKSIDKLISRAKSLINDLDINAHQDHIDKIILLCTLLHISLSPKAAPETFRGWSDERIFAEVLKMVKETTALVKLQHKYLL